MGILRLPEMRFGGVPPAVVFRASWHEADVVRYRPRAPSGHGAAATDNRQERVPPCSTPRKTGLRGTESRHEICPALRPPIPRLSLHMATVTATFAQILAAAAGYTLSDDGMVSIEDRVVHRARVDVGNRMTDADYFSLVEWITNTHPDRAALVLAYADRLHMDDLGALGLAIRTAPTLRQSLTRAERYFRLITDTVRYRLDESGPLAVFRIESQTAPHEVLDFRNECALAAFARNLIRLGGDDLAFEEVSFRHPCKADAARYAAGLGCPVRFAADQDAIIVP